MNSTAVEIARQVRQGERLAADVLEQAIAGILQGDGEVNSFTHFTFERARSEAAHIDLQRARGETLPPLAGVPYAVKNLFDVEALVTIAGGHVNRDRPAASRDGTLVARMRDAGAVLVGTLNMDEHAYGFTTENSHYGATHNPRDLERTAGGSSGGSGAAVAAGFVPVALGSDTNGSIRVPSSFCGTFGLKPTFGRLSRAGSFPFVTSLDHLGPFARSADDLALIYDVLQGPDPLDHACAQRAIEPVAGRAKSMDGVRVAVLGGYFHHWASETARQAVELAADALEARRTIELQGVEQARAAAFVITGAQAGALHRPRLRTHYQEYEPHSRNRLVAGSILPAAWLMQAQRIRERFRGHLMRVFNDFDVLIAPATPVVAPVIGTDWLDLGGERLSARPNIGLFTQPISAIGLPVCAAPVWPERGNPANLPIAVQLIAAPWREDLCLAAAARLEQAGIARSPVATLGRG